MSPAALVQMAGIFSNGLSSSISQQLHSYFKAAGDLGVKPTYPSDLLAPERRENKNMQHTDGGDDVFEKTEQQLEEEKEDAGKWKMLKNDVEPEEVGQSGVEFQGPSEKNRQAFWGGGVSESPISSLENLTPGQADQHQHQHQAGPMSFLRSQESLSSTSANAHIASMNGGGGVEKDVPSGEHQCRIYPKTKVTASSDLFSERLLPSSGHWGLLLFNVLHRLMLLWQTSADDIIITGYYL